MKTVKTTFIALVLLCAVLSPVTAVERFVANLGQTPSSGHLSWDTAALTIQEAISAASTGDIITISNGTYSADSGSFVLSLDSKYVSLRGLSGNPDDVVIDGLGERRLMEVRVRDDSVAETFGTIIFSGLTFANGYAPNGIGAGVDISYDYEYSEPVSGTLWFKDCIFTNNIIGLRIPGTGASGYYGGALVARGGKSDGAGCDLELRVTGSCFADNHANSHGGAIYFSGARQERLRIDDCHFKGNCGGYYASSFGATMALYGADAIVSNCVIENSESFS